MAIVPPPQTQEAAAERMNQGYECVDWYLCRRRYRG
jgi:peroxiredoxin (alkyl hydroperoxide reductase subunit C)